MILLQIDLQRLEVGDIADSALFLPEIYPFAFFCVCYIMNTLFSAASIHGISLLYKGAWV